MSAPMAATSETGLPPGTAPSPEMGTPPGNGVSAGVGKSPDMGSRPGTDPPPGMRVPTGAGTYRAAANGPLFPEDAAEHGIWLCGGGELPAALLAALTGRTPWTPAATGPSDSATYPSGGLARHAASAPGGPSSGSAADYDPRAGVLPGAGGSGEAGADRPISAGFAQDGALDGLAPRPRAGDIPAAAP
jgi:hypothetical protein